MEGLALQLLAGWSALQAKMREHTLGALEGSEAQEYASRTKYPDDFILDQYKKIVREKWGVQFPQVFADIYNYIKDFRDNFAHMVELKINDEDATITIVRRGGFEPYIEGEWRQRKYDITIKQRELVDASYTAREAEKMLHIIYHLYCLFNEKQPADDEVWNFKFVPWWDGRWGPPPETEDDWWGPVGRYRHHTRERTYWRDDKNEWHHFDKNPI